MKLELSFPDTKISEAFLEFAEPLLEKEGAPPTAEEVEKVLQLASTVWNAVVFDTVRAILNGSRGYESSSQAIRRSRH
jgi:hypothetical protein